MARPVRTLFTIMMDALVLLALAITAGLVCGFFGALASTGIGGWFIDLSELLTVPLGLPAWKTPYGGVFTGDAAATVVIVLAVEWLLSRVRRALP